MTLSGRLVPVADITSADRCAMFELMDRHYTAVDPETFATDLAEKQWIIELRERGTERLCGFSTQMICDIAVAGRVVRALFSGDTIVDRQHWGDPALSHVWGRLALELIDQTADVETFWFLVSQGHRTYRFLPLFFHEFYPRFDHPTPAWAEEVINALARHKFSDAYDPMAGVIRATANQYCLRSELRQITVGRAADPHVRFFHERNPGHARGDELCCLASLTRENFTAAAYRVIGPEPAVVEVR